MTTSTMDGDRDGSSGQGGKDSGSGNGSGNGSSNGNGGGGNNSGDTNNALSPTKDYAPPFSPSTLSSFASSGNQSPGAIVQWVRRGREESAAGVRKL